MVAVFTGLPYFWMEKSNDPKSKIMEGPKLHVSTTDGSAVQPVIEFRPAAVLSEGLLLLATVIGLFIRSFEFLVIPGSALALLYLFFSWYLFKAAYFRGWDLLLSIPGGIILQFSVVSILFQAMNWGGRAYMAIFAMLSCSVGIMIAAVWYIFRRKNPLEYRLSIKLATRLALCVIGIFVLQ